MRSIKKLLLNVMLILMLTTGLSVAAEEATEYVIQKGDTLWGLSGKFLNDPHYWPNLWSKNPQVTNPHLIYPGQTLRFRDGKLEILSNQAESGAQKASGSIVLATPTQQMIHAAEQEVVREKSYKVSGNEGWLLESEQDIAGRVIAGQHNRVIFGEDDTVFTDIGKSNGGVDGAKYTIVRKSGQIKHPVTNKNIGFKVNPLGSLQITYATDSNSRAIIVKSSKEIELGDLLVASKPSKRREIALKMLTSQEPLKGYIVASSTGTNGVAKGDVVYTDLGKENGVEPGNMLYVTRKVKIETMKVDGYVGQLPDEVLGAMVVVDSGSKTSTAIIVKSIDAIFIGDEIVSAAR